jgi:hypothetical protein
MIMKCYVYFDYIVLYYMYTHSVCTNCIMYCHTVLYSVHTQCITLHSTHLIITE